MKIAMPPHLKKQIPPQPNAAVPFLSREPPAEPPTIEPPVIPPLDSHPYVLQKLRDLSGDLRAVAEYLDMHAALLEGAK